MGSLKTSLLAYVGTATPFLLIFLPGILQPVIAKLLDGFFYGPFIYYLIVNIVLWYFCSEEYKVAVRAALLGFVTALGVYMFLYLDNRVAVFGIYMVVMSVFHYSEFLTIAVIQPKLVTIDSFMINHSKPYKIAAVASWIEYAAELYFLPDLKGYILISYIGLAVCVAGEILRKTAMLTANSNFNHLVQNEKADGHTLVTTGVYAIFRHPSYVGWFYWSIGTQIILLNPICVLIYAIASWLFFNDRVRVEEIYLLSFFGQQYCDYQQKVGTGLPFINGYIIKP